MSLLPGCESIRSLRQKLSLGVLHQAGRAVPKRVRWSAPSGPHQDISFAVRNPNTNHWDRRHQQCPEYRLAIHVTVGKPLQNHSIRGRGFMITHSTDDESHFLLPHVSMSIRRECEPVEARVTRHDLTSVREIDMGDRYGRSDINETSMGLSIWDVCYRYRYIDMVIYHIDTVILDIDMGYGLMIWDMTVSIWEMTISIWDILSLWSRHYSQ